ncbi:SAP30-binding protein [Calliphora vicina]|uniref:SAP30-binding protein n=1 Tax=Calliphora vicina TaxID=7373 RepID=UPI00325B9178
MSNSALASLTAQYTDSENEDDQQESPDSQNSQASQVIIPPSRHTPQQTPEKREKDGLDMKERKYSKKRKSKKIVKRLVSYQDDTIISDEAEGEEEEEEDDYNEDDDERLSSDLDDEQDQRNNSEFKRATQKRNESPIVVDDDSFDPSKKVSTHSKSDKYAKYAKYSFALPPDPRGKPLPELSDKIQQLYEKMETNNMDMNRIIQQRKEFRNPSIYEKLIQFCDINEFGTNYPPEIYDPLQWGSESFYEELARVQKIEMVKRQKEKKDTDKIEQVSALARKVEEEAKKRKSKWDQPATSVKPVVPPTLTTTVTGTKGTVISAFGSLPKKPTA